MTKFLSYLTILALLSSNLAWSVGRIQNEDVKSLTDITSAVLTTTGNLTISNACISSIGALTNLGVGQFIYDTTTSSKIPSGTTIAGIPGSCSAGQVQMSQNATASATGDTITFGGQKSQLINDTKAYVTGASLNDQLSTLLSTNKILNTSSTTAASLPSDITITGSGTGLTVTTNSAFNGTTTMSAASSGSVYDGLIIQNTSNTASSDARIRIESGGSSGGSPYLNYLIPATVSWSSGIDTSNSNSFVIAAATGVTSTNKFLSINTSGNSTFSGTATIQGAGTGLTVTNNAQVTGQMGIGIIPNADNRIALAVKSPSGAAGVRLDIVDPQVGGKEWFLDGGATAALGSFSIVEAGVSSAITILDSSLKVGIGSVTPPKKLSVRDITSTSSTVGNGEVIRVLGGDSNVNHLSEIGLTYGGGQTDTFSPAIIGYQYTSASGFTDGDLYFATRNVTTDTAPSARMRITAAGLVGIGITPASTKLEVNGDITQYNGSGASIGKIWNDSGKYSVQADTANVSALKLDAPGNQHVQIFTNSANRFDVDGSGNGFFAGNFVIGNNNASLVGNNVALIYSNANQTNEGNSTLYMGAGATNGTMNMYFGVNQSSQYSYIGSALINTSYKPLILQPNGSNVGIGVLTNPGALLEVNGTSKFDGNAIITANSTLQFDNNANILWKNSGGTARNIMTINASNNVFITGADSSSQATGGVQLAYSNGNVGLFLRGDGTMTLPNIGTSAAALDYLCWNPSGGQITGSSAPCTSSTIKVKENVKDLHLGLEQVLSMRPVSFDYKKEYNPRHIGNQVGFIAEEVNKIDSRLVTKDEKGEINGVQYGQMSAVLVKAIQEQQAEIKELKQELKALKKGK